MTSALDLASLRLVCAIADSGTITGAASALGYTQPAVSQHVRRLERRLGTALLERHPRGVRLTEAGRVLARYGAAVSTTVDAAEREVSALAGLRAGRVRLVGVDAAAATLVPAALVSLRLQAPAIEVSVREVDPDRAAAELREGRCDLAVTVEDAPAASPGSPGEDQLRGLTRRRLLSDPSLLVLAESDPLASRRRLHLRDLAQARWVAGRPQRRGHLDRAAHAAGFTPHVCHETDDHATTFALVAAGLGIALIPGLLAPLAAACPGLALHAVGGVPRHTVVALTTGDLLRVPAVAATLEALVEAAAVR